MQLHQQGASQVAIAALVGLNRDSVRRYLNASGFPEITRPGKRSHLDPYKDYLQQRWETGERNVKRLLVELRERGYRQGETIVYDYLRTLRQQPEGVSASVVRKKGAVRSAAQTALSAREAAWLFVCNPHKLRISQAVRLDHLRVTNEDLGLAYQLAQDFREDASGGRLCGWGSEQKDVSMVVGGHPRQLSCWSLRNVFLGSLSGSDPAGTAHRRRMRKQGKRLMWSGGIPWLSQRLACFVRMTLSFSRVRAHATPACLLLFLQRYHLDRAILLK